ncbi:MAG TPA: hypothetical protein VF608_06420 [Thermoanaerobaculia bacterium]
MTLRPVLALAGILALTPLTAHATISRAVAFEEKVEDAAAIVVGTCIGQQSRYDSARNWILTYSTFRVEKTLKGFPSQEITIVTPGGTVGHIAQEIIGVPKFKQGDERVLFVRNTQAGPTVLYLEQGDYHVIQDRGEKIVRPAVSEAVMIDTGHGAAAADEPMRTLRDFEGRVKDAVKRQDLQKMELVERQKRAQSSIWSQIQRNRILVLLALVGAALATWQLYKRW